MKDALINARLSRDFVIRAEGVVDEELRTVEVSFSSEEPVLRRSFFSDPWQEVLGHNDDEVNLVRLNKAAPVLYNHDRMDGKNRIGVVERAWLEAGRGRAILRMSKRPDIDPIWQDIRDGILRNVSVSYTIEDFETAEENKDSPDVIRITRWTPLEISLVDIPADHTVGVGRNDPGGNPGVEPSLDLNPKLKEQTMTKATEKVDATREQPKASPEVDVEKIRAQAMEEGRKEALAEADARIKASENAEQKRRTAIREAFKAFGDQFRDLMDTCLEDKAIDETQARKLLLDEIGKDKQPASDNVRIEVGADEREKFMRAAESALSTRAGIEKPESGKRTELIGYSLLELARKCLEVHGVRTSNLDKRDIVGRAFTHSSSDFSYLLSNNANKAMLRGYSESPEVFDQFTRIGNLSDYKTADRVGMSEFSNLDEVKEGGEYTYGTLSDRREQIKLAKYGKLFSITREAIINDDLNAFTEIPRKMGRAARRKVGDLVFSILNDNPNMADGTALFHADHSNLAGSGAAPTAATVGAARAAMRKQKDQSGKATLNIAPSFLIVPVALEDTARVLMASETDPSKTNSRVPNPVRNAAEIVTDARLDATSAAAWYMAANPDVFDTIEVAYLDGNPNPFLEQQDGWSVDGVDFKVRIDAAAKALEHRTLYKNPGS